MHIYNYNRSMETFIRMCRMVHRPATSIMIIFGLLAIYRELWLVVSLPLPTFHLSLECILGLFLVVEVCYELLV